MSRGNYGENNWNKHAELNRFLFGLTDASKNDRLSPARGRVDQFQIRERGYLGLGKESDKVLLKIRPFRTRFTFTKGKG